MEHLEIPSYELHLNSNGKGKGLAIYFKKDMLRHEVDIKQQNIQISKFTSPEIDLLAIYRSQNGNLKQLIEYLKNLINREKPVLIIGDFNFCFLEDSSNFVTKYLDENSCSQIVKEPTHIEGNLIDQAHLRDTEGNYQCSVEVHSKYYTDHRGVAIIIKRVRLKYIHNDVNKISYF